MLQAPEGRDGGIIGGMARNLVDNTNVEKKKQNRSESSEDVWDAGQGLGQKTPAVECVQSCCKLFLTVRAQQGRELFHPKLIIPGLPH